MKPLTLLRVLLALFFGGVFIYAGSLKLIGLGPMQFLEDIRSFHLLGDPWAAWLAMSLPWLEILCGVAVVAHVWQKAALWLLNAALLAFLVAIVSAWMRGIDPTCGCFGKTEQATSHLELVLRDVALLAVGGVLLFWPRRAAPSA